MAAPSSLPLLHLLDDFSLAFQFFSSVPEGFFIFYPTTLSIQISTSISVCLPVFLSIYIFFIRQTFYPFHRHSSFSVSLSRCTPTSSTHSFVIHPSTHQINHPSNSISSHSPSFPPSLSPSLPSPNDRVLPSVIPAPLCFVLVHPCSIFVPSSSPCCSLVFLPGPSSDLFPSLLHSCSPLVSVLPQTSQSLAGVCRRERGESRGHPLLASTHFNYKVDTAMYSSPHHFASIR